MGPKELHLSMIVIVAQGVNQPARCGSRTSSRGASLWGRNRLGLLRGPGCLLLRSREQVLHLEVDAVGPAEADDVALVSCGDFYVRGPADDVVLFTDGAIVLEVLANGL